MKRREEKWHEAMCGKCRPKAGGFQKFGSSMDIQRSVHERERQWVLVKEPSQRHIVSPIFPPVSYGREGANVPWALSQYVSPRLQGIFVAAGTCGGFVWEKSGPVFTRGGVICKDVGDAAQVACLPFRHVVKEIAGVLGEGRFECFLLSADGEPLGPPVCGILPALLPFVLGAASVL